MIFDELLEGKQVVLEMERRGGLTLECAAFRKCATQSGDPSQEPLEE